MRVQWIQAVLAALISLTFFSGSVLADDDNEWQEKKQEQKKARQDENWSEVDPAEVADGEAPLALHRRLPKLYLTTNLAYDPGSTLVRDPYGDRAGRRLDSQVGASIDFDFRFWYLFIGTHMARYGGDGSNLDEYAVRGGFLIPFGERFAIVAAAWMGMAQWEGEGQHTDLLNDVGISFYDEDGFLIGASIGIRVMLTQWFGLTADISASSMFFEGESEIGFGDSGAVELNRWTTSSGIVFAF